MTAKIKTIDMVEVNIHKWDEDYTYQQSLTGWLDSHGGDFDQEIINQIVLWKVNRYAETGKDTLAKINSISKTSRKENAALTREVLEELLSIKGFGLPMATTVLRFKNPHIYQLIDQRVYRFIFGDTMPKTTKHDQLIEIYSSYLKRMREVCEKYNIEFSTADRTLYQADIIENKKIKLTGYGA